MDHARRWGTLRQYTEVLILPQCLANSSNSVMGCLSRFLYARTTNHTVLSGFYCRFFSLYGDSILAFPGTDNFRIPRLKNDVVLCDFAIDSTPGMSRFNGEHLISTELQP